MTAKSLFAIDAPNRKAFLSCVAKYAVSGSAVAGVKYARVNIVEKSFVQVARNVSDDGVCSECMM